MYSLVTQKDGVGNFNLCTYVTAISMKPKRFVVGVYKDTYSQELMNKSEKAVLQILGKHNLPQCKILGFRSGWEANKIEYFQKKDLLSKWNDFPILNGISACMLMKKISISTPGDHDLVVFEVIKSKTFHSDVLMLNDLRAARMIRI